MQQQISSRIGQQSTHARVTCAGQSLSGRAPPRQVGTSEAALLVKMGVKPFEYGLVVHHVWEGGIFDPSVLKINDAVLMGKFMEATGQVAALSLALNYPTDASYPHLMMNGIMNITAVAAEAEYFEFETAKKVEEFLKDPAAYCACH